jgi:hypothetical protein
VHWLGIIPITIRMLQSSLNVCAFGRRSHNDAGSSDGLAKLSVRNSESLSDGDLLQANGNAPLAAWLL